MCVLFVSPFLSVDSYVTVRPWRQPFLLRSGRKGTCSRRLHRTKYGLGGEESSETGRGARQQAGTTTGCAIRTTWPWCLVAAFAPRPPELSSSPRCQASMHSSQNMCPLCSVTAQRRRTAGYLDRDCCQRCPPRYPIGQPHPFDLPAATPGGVPLIVSLHRLQC